MTVHRVVVLALDGVLPIDLGIPTEVFKPRPITPYELSVCATQRGSVRTSSPFTLSVDAGLEALEAADTVVVPGFENYTARPDERALAALRAAAARGARIVSICTGAFALAAAGLLDGRLITTHWASADDMESLYPPVRVDRDVLYIDDTIMTSAGISAGIDLCLYIVRKDLGAGIANVIARDIVAAPHREGGQAQYIVSPLSERDTTTLTATREWALAHLDADLSLSALARHARRSSRSLTRAWREETGTSPHRWVLTARINAARELLEATQLSIDEITERCGLGTATNFRARFRDALDTTPTAYRSTFQGRMSA